MATPDTSNLRRLRTVWLGLLLLTLCGAVLEASSGIGSPVSAIEYRSDTAGLNIVELQNLIAVEVGVPLTQDQIARSLRNIQASGSSSEAEVLIRPASDAGVVVTFVLWSRIQVETVRLQGDLILNRREVRAILEIGEAEPLIEDRILRSVFALEDFYESHGFLEATVLARPVIDRARKVADVTFEVDPGRPFEVTSIQFDGDIAPFSVEDLQNRLKVKPGKRINRREVRGDAERLGTWLFDQGYRLALVERPESSVDWNDASVTLAYRVDVGPQFHVEVLGGDIRRLKKNGSITFLGWQRYDEALLLQSISRIRRYFQQQGHYDVEVDWTETQTDEMFHLVITVVPGPVYELVDIGFSGNESINQSQLEVLMGTTTRRLFSAGSGRLVDSALSDDMENIRSYYRLQGYWDARIGPYDVSRRLPEPAATLPEDEPRRYLSVLIPIDEGLQRRTVDLVLEGTDEPIDPELYRKLPLRSGGPFHPQLLSQAESAIRADFDSRGYESAQVSATLDWSEDGTLVDVHIKVLEGPRSIIDRVILRGNRHTRSAVIRRSLGLGTGQTFNTDRLLQAQRDLYGLGAFSRADVRRAPGTPFKGERDILVEVDEANRNRVSYGGGFDSENGVSGIFGFTRSNITGRGISGRFDLRLSQKDKLGRLLIYQPFLGRFRLSTTGSLFYIDEERGGEIPFDSKRRGGQLEVERVGDASRVGLLYEYRWVRALPIGGAEEIPDLERDFENVRISSITPNYQLDHRDDPIDPTRGWTGGLQLEYAFPFIGAEEEFLKGFANYSHYLNLGSIGIVAGNVRVGGIEPISGNPVTARGSDDELGENECPIEQKQLCVPISERFFSGGRTTHRAYGRDRLGIVGETLVEITDEDGNVTGLTSIGGNGLFLINLDYRFPILGPVGGNLFVDSGNVWSDWREMDFSQMKTGIGIGARYKSPVGLVRLDVGWKLDREPTEDSYVIFFSFGNPF